MQGILLAIAVLAATAVAAPAASPSSGVEVLDEAAGGHCPQVFLDGDHGVSDGCAVHGASTSPMTFLGHTGTFETPANNVCNHEFEARIDESGSGWIYNQVLTGANCGLAPCDEAAPEHSQLPWPARLSETGGVTTLRTTFCVRIVANPEGSAPAVSCTLDVPVTDLGDHAYELSATQLPCIESGGALEVSFAWVTEGLDTNIEVTHP